jgi:hypothetical protein
MYPFCKSETFSELLEKFLDPIVTIGFIVHPSSTKGVRDGTEKIDS